MGRRNMSGGGMVRLGWEHPEQIVFRDWGRQEKPYVMSLHILQMQQSMLEKVL